MQASLAVALFTLQTWHWPRSVDGDGGGLLVKNADARQGKKRSEVVGMPPDRMSNQGCYHGVLMQRSLVRRSTLMAHNGAPTDDVGNHVDRTFGE